MIHARSRHGNRAAGIVQLQLAEHRRTEIARVCGDHIQALGKGIADAVGAVEVLADLLRMNGLADAGTVERFAASLRERHPGMLGLAWLADAAATDARAPEHLAGRWLVQPA